MGSKSGKQWGGLFKKQTDPRTELFTESISFDARLYPEDIEASIAHARSLVGAKVLSAAEAKKMELGLKAVAKKIAAGKVQFQIELEDIHTHIENELKKEIGDLALKLHTGRSRNDQVVTAVRLYLKKQISTQILWIQNLQETLIGQAEKNKDVIVSGYTHLQPAQPILLAHYLLAYFEMLQRDKRRFFEALGSTDVLPLGSSALAGTPYNVDRKQVAKDLDFETISQNSLDAVSDRDFILDYLYATATLSIHLSRLSEDLIIWNSAEFGFVTMDDGFSTGSSLMPQKKNPDVAEIARGKAALSIGNLTTMLTLLKGLPMSYNRDLQDDKRILFQAVDTLNMMLPAFEGMIETLKFNPNKMEKTLSKGYSTATTLLDYLISKGMAFREGHHLVGHITAYMIEKDKKSFMDIKLDKLKEFSGLIEKDVYEWLEVGRGTSNRSLTMREVLGGTGPKTVATALAAAKKRVRAID